jgi:hypothetical protein
MIVGVTDIYPFLLNLFQGKYAVADSLLALATLQAIISNNLVKAIYAVSLAGNRIRRMIIIGFTVIIISNIILAILIYHF